MFTRDVNISKWINTRLSIIPFNILKKFFVNETMTITLFRYRYWCKYQCKLESTGRLNLNNSKKQTMWHQLQKVIKECILVLKHCNSPAYLFYCSIQFILHLFVQYRNISTNLYGCVMEGVKWFFFSLCCNFHTKISFTLRPYVYCYTKTGVFYCSGNCSMSTVLLKCLLY